jgi:hypothetical protein
MGALAPGVSARQAGDVIGVLTSFETYDQLTREYGWGWERAESWVAETMINILLP